MILGQTKIMIESLEEWFSTNGLTGYDPFDAKGLPYLLFMQKSRFTRVGLNFLLEGLPRASRVLLGVHPAINAKGIALLTSAYVNRYESSGERYFLDKAIETTNWLLEEGERWDPDVVAWGYPFDWQSRVLIPRNTPSSVVTAFGLQAILAVRQYQPGLIPTDYFMKIGHFFTQSLNRSPDGCFSYTPVDQFRVHNANLFSVWSLLKISQITNNNKLIAAAIPALNYTVNQQGPQGEFGYWGDEDNNPIIDHYHTGYVIRMLNRIQLLQPNLNLEAVITKAMGYYLGNLFDDDFPRDQISRLYPVNIHTLSEMILLYCELPQYRVQLVSKLDTVIDFLRDTMQFKPGQFAYKYYPRHLVKIPFFRWNQAWVYYALSKLETVTN